MAKNKEQNIPAAIAFMVALVSGPAAFFIVLGAGLSTYITVPVIVYVASTVAVWYFENMHGKHY